MERQGLGAALGFGEFCARSVEKRARVFSVMGMGTGVLHSVLAMWLASLFVGTKRSALATRIYELVTERKKPARVHATAFRDHLPATAATTRKLFNRWWLLGEGRPLHRVTP